MMQPKCLIEKQRYDISQDGVSCVISLGHWTNEVPIRNRSSLPTDRFQLSRECVFLNLKFIYYTLWWNKWRKWLTENVGRCSYGVSVTSQVVHCVSGFIGYPGLQTKVSIITERCLWTQDAYPKTNEEYDIEVISIYMTCMDCKLFPSVDGLVWEFVWPSYYTRTGMLQKSCDIHDEAYSSGPGSNSALAVEYSPWNRQCSS